MKSLVDYINECCKNGKKCNKKGGRGNVKNVKAMVKDLSIDNYDHKKYKRDPELYKYLQSKVKESLNESQDNEDLIEDFRDWVQDTIDSWVQNADDSVEDMTQMKYDLEVAGDYFYNEFEHTFLPEYGYDSDTEWLDEFDDIINDYVESTEDYLADKYDNWGEDDEDYRPMWA